MSRALVKLNDGERDWYFEWSSICDAPRTYGMSREELEAWTKEEYGREGLQELPERLRRVDEKGTSYHDNTTAEDLIRFNRAGKGETCLNREQLIAMYCHRTGEIRGRRVHDD